MGSELLKDWQHFRLTVFVIYLLWTVPICFHRRVIGLFICTTHQTLSQFQFRFHIKFINSNSIFYLLIFTTSRYSEYPLGIPTPSSLYSKQDCHGRNISELKNLIFLYQNFHLKQISPLELPIQFQFWNWPHVFHETPLRGSIPKKTNVSCHTIPLVNSPQCRRYCRVVQFKSSDLNHWFKWL